jgi:hypothetical protein
MEICGAKTNTQAYYTMRAVSRLSEARRLETGVSPDRESMRDSAR